VRICGLARDAVDPRTLAEDARGDGAGIVHLYNVGVVGAEAARADGAEATPRLVEHHDGGASRTHDGGELLHDGLRRLLQLHGAAEDLGDGVEEVDLLVAPGEFLGDARALPLELQQRREHRRHAHPHCGEAGLVAAAHLQPPAGHAGRREPEGAALG